MIEYPVLPQCDDNGNCEPFVPSKELGPIDCNKAFLCDVDYGRCDCFGGSCRADRETAQLTVRVAGNELIGVSEGAAFQNARHARAPLGVIHFQRAP